MHRDESTHSVGEGEQATPMVASPLRSGTRRQVPVILIHRSAPPPVASGDATVLDEDSFESVGTVAIRLFAAWKLPRMSLEPARERSDGPQPSEVSGRRTTDHQD